MILSEKRLKNGINQNARMIGIGSNDYLMIRDMRVLKLNGRGKHGKLGLTGNNMTDYKPEPMNHIEHLDPNHRYACYNREPVDKVEYSMQEGWTVCGKRKTIKHTTEWLSFDGCGHSYSLSDPACTGCKWRNGV